MKIKNFMYTNLLVNIKYINLQKKQVPDCKITGEIWIKDKVDIKLIGKILCHEAYEKPFKYKYGDNKSAELYKWTWEWIEMYNMNRGDINEFTGY